MDTPAAHALIRFGLGRRGGEPLPAAPHAWLARQLEGPDPAFAAPCHSAAEGVLAIRAFNMRQVTGATDNPVREIFRADTAAAIETLLTTESPFRERLVWFWANHFTVSTRRPLVAALVNSHIRDAIRPHVTGRFADMLHAVMRHPAMLFYLDNQASIGPDSQAGKRQRKGLNENLARECLELHTVTPAAKYSQADVTAFARVLTGWSIAYEPANNPGFIYRANAHEPGAQIVMGQSWDGGEAAGLAALTWLGHHPATYHNIAIKLVRHFTADTPAPAAVAAIETVLRRTDGDLKAASLALLDLKEAWQPLTKLRTPFDYVLAVVRALDLPPGNRPDINAIMGGLGQSLHNAPLPNGWSDVAPDWAAPEAMLRRIDWAYAVAARTKALDPVATAESSLGPLLPAATREQIARAGSHREAMTLLLAAPEFQRR